LKLEQCHLFRSLCFLLLFFILDYHDSRDHDSLTYVHRNSWNCTHPFERHRLIKSVHINVIFLLLVKNFFFFREKSLRKVLANISMNNYNLRINRDCFFSYSGPTCVSFFLKLGFSGACTILYL